MDQEAIKHPEIFSMDEIAIENAIKSNWKGSIDSLAVEIAKKTVFQEENNTDMNAIKQAIQPKIQTTF